jgi:uncharacterized membrane protein
VQHLTLADCLEFLNLLFAGLLAGEEFVIRFGVRGPLAGLEPRTQIALRQALIRKLRVLVPTIFFLALLSGAAMTALGGGGLAFVLRCAGVLALLTFIGVTLGGTVPINKAALDWDPAAPPPQWRALVARWEMLDTVRTWAALAGFALFLAAALIR